MNIRRLTLKNLIKRPFRTGALILTAALMTAAVFGGQIIARSMEKGLGSLEERLGADIVVVPEEAEAKEDLENILLQGTPAYFYMDKNVQEKIDSIEGVGQTSAQYFLVSANAECCSVKVQIIGFDENSDIAVKSWLKDSYSGTLGTNDVIVGSSLSTQAGEELTLYGIKCKAVGKLEETGTGLDTAIYATNETVQGLINGSREQGISVLSKHSPEDVISSVYVNVENGADIDDVVFAINQNVDGVQAVRTKSMITGTADKLSVIAGSISVVTKAVWVLAAVIMTAAFSVLASVRKKEFAVLRVIGFSRRRLGSLVLSESFLVCTLGVISGLVIVVMIVFPFGHVIEQSTGLPYLSPDMITVLRYALLTGAAVLLTGMLSSAYCAYRLSHADTGRILREGD